MPLVPLASCSPRCTADVGRPAPPKRWVLHPTRTTCSGLCAPAVVSLQRLARTVVAMAGEEGPVSPRLRKPEWVRIMEEDADDDEDIAKVLKGTNGDPELIRENMRRELMSKGSSSSLTGMGNEGSEVPPRVAFREMNQFGFWLWIEFARAPVDSDRELLEGVLRSWYTVGKLGGYNSQNLQVFYGADDDQSFFDYDNDSTQGGMVSFLHEIGEMEFQEDWARVRLDLGTADELALDVLLNMLLGASQDVLALKTIYVGGQNADWPAPEEELGNMSPEVGIDPMRLPIGMDDEMDALGELDAASLSSAFNLGEGDDEDGDADGREPSREAYESLSGLLKRRTGGAGGAGAGGGGGVKAGGASRGGADGSKKGGGGGAGDDLGDLPPMPKRQWGSNWQRK